MPFVHLLGTRAKVIYSYHAQNNDELTLDEGQVLKVLDMKLEDPGWWKGEMNGKIGVFPDNFVELIPENDVTTQPPSLPGVSKTTKPIRSHFSFKLEIEAFAQKILPGFFIN